jgi:hypothetical protein
MVFVPEWTWDARLFGLDGSVPRAVPSDLVAAALSVVFGGQLAQKLILLSALAGAGWGVQRLLADRPTVARAAAGIFYIWNPFVHQRLSMGHWPIIVTYAALPWIVHCGRRITQGRRGSWPGLIIALGIASISGPFGALVGTLVALAVVANWKVLVASVALNLPWLLPSVLLPGGMPARPSAIGAFAANPDTPLGLWGSLVTLGGIWNSLVPAPERSGWAWIPLWVVILGVIVAGLSIAWRQPHWRRVTLTGLGMFVVAGAVATPSLQPLFERLALLPGGGFLRDSQKFVAALALVEAIGLGLGVAELRERSTKLAIALVAVPILLSPSLGWGLGGLLHTVSYPPEWHRAADVIRRSDHPGDILTVPWGLYRRLSWNPGRAVLDPAQRFFSRPAVVGDDLLVGDLAIPGEDARAGILEAVLNDPPVNAADLASSGIGWVLSHDSPADLVGASLEVSGDSLSLYRIPAPTVVHRPAPPTIVVIAGHLVATVTFLGAALLLAKRLGWHRCSGSFSGSRSIS